jgi:hypothetical protein
MNPYRPKVVDAFDHVIYFSIARLKERIVRVSSCISDYASSTDAEKSDLAKKDYINSFLEAKQQYPQHVTDDNIAMYILTNVSS